MSQRIPEHEDYGDLGYELQKPRETVAPSPHDLQRPSVREPESPRAITKVSPIANTKASGIQRSTTLTRGRATALNIPPPKLMPKVVNSPSPRRLLPATLAASTRSFTLPHNSSVAISPVDPAALPTPERLCMLARLPRGDSSWTTRKQHRKSETNTRPPRISPDASANVRSPPPR